LVSPIVTSAEDLPLTEIRGSHGWSDLGLGELWQRRELVYFLIWRDIKVRYKQTLLGAAWALMQPLFAMFAFTLVFGKLARMPSSGLPYPLFSLAGLVPWMFFVFAVSECGNSMVSSQHLIKKVYFPRLAIPLGTVLAGLVDFGLALLLLMIVMAWYGLVPGPRVVALPLFVLLALVAALGLGLWLAALNVLYRDIRYVIPFLLQMLLFATPVAYPTDLLPEPFRTLSGLNPMAGVVNGFRWALLGTDAPAATVWLSALVAIALCVSGAMFFRRMERQFADVV
jgi:lipopolysaccharide transport system permease protein